MKEFTLIILIFSVIVPYICEENPEPLQQESQKKLNVVIFFTHVDTKCLALKEDTLGFLNLEEQTRIKHSSDEHDSSNLQEETKIGSVHCKELLKDSLLSLTHFCHTVMKMKTAVASVSSKEKTNDIQEPDTPFHTPHLDMGADTKGRFKRFNPLTHDKAVVAQAEQIWENSPDKKTYKARNIITGAKHTEVFQLRMKRNTDDDDEETTTEKKNIQIEIVDEVPTEKRTEKPPWDVLDIVKHVRYSFLGKIFQNTLKDQVKADQDDLVDISKLGKEKLDPGLFSMVKQTLDALLEPPENSFLLVVFGGHLRAITDKHSPIVQSIKHVIESTESEKTLIIVTGSCAEEPDDSDNETVEKTYAMPLYAKGPDSDMLSECKLLYDIPLTIRRILEVRTGVGQQFPESISS